MQIPQESMVFVEKVEYVWSKTDVDDYISAHGLGLQLWSEFYAWADTFIREMVNVEYEYVLDIERRLEGAWRKRLLKAYADRFINRTEIYGQQWIDEEGSCQYPYKRNGDKGFESNTELLICKHLNGDLTMSLVATDKDGMCKWCVWDSDTDNGDLLRIKAVLEALGLTPHLESVRPGRDGHMWLFFSRPVKASDLIAFNGDVVQKLGIAGMEFVPKSATKLSQIRAPLGLHKKAGAQNLRGQFEGSVKTNDVWQDAQMVFIAELQPDDPAIIEAIAKQVQAHKPPEAKRIPILSSNREQLNRPPILSLVQTKGKAGDDLIAACPACLYEGGDSHGDNLRINSRNPTLFNCVSNGPGFGHSTQDIWAALNF